MLQDNFFHEIYFSEQLQRHRDVGVQAGAKPPQQTSSFRRRRGEPYHENQLCR